MKLADLGWSPFFARQLAPQDLTAALPGRVTGMQRTGVTVSLAVGEREAPLGGRWFRGAAEGRPAVGDWVLFDQVSGKIERLLKRKSLLKRVSAGATSRIQLIGANIDTLFVVTACDEEFNPSRLERYLSLAHEGNVQPVLVLTKRDLADDPAKYLDQAATLEQGLAVESVNALDRATLDGVAAWCGPGQTVALAGSSGVGKSTLINTLCGSSIQATGSVRGDAKGRHVVRFYLVAMLFVVFDVELVFLYPWAVHYAEQGAFSDRLFLFGEMLVFVAILLVAYAYAFKKRVFEWNRGD